ncbi:MAG: hypothetical protein WBA91_02220, partial [Paracoccaceae bacterium]
MTQAPSPNLRRDSGQGIVCLLAGIAIFSVQDLILKGISGSYPLYQAMVIRSLTALPLMFALVCMNGGPRTLIAPGLWQMILRGIIMCGAYFCYY